MSIKVFEFPRAAVVLRCEPAMITERSCKDVSEISGLNCNYVTCENKNCINMDALICKRSIHCDFLRIFQENAIWICHPSIFRKRQISNNILFQRNIADNFLMVIYTWISWSRLGMLKCHSNSDVENEIKKWGNLKEIGGNG